MKKGQVVKCVVSKVSSIPDAYLTDGENYVISAGEGDVDLFGDVINDPLAFEIVDDDGDRLFNYTMDSSHALWELAE